MSIDNVSEIKIRWAPSNRDNLIAWISCVVNGSLRLDDIRVHRERSGKRVIRYPFMRSRRGSRCTFFRPINKETAQAIETAILQALDNANPRLQKG